MVRYNNLKIFINATDAKLGGNIGAMLSPYLFSNSLIEFCKQFNDLTAIFNSTVCLNVKIYVDINEKIYSFFVNLPSVVLIFNFFFSIKKKLKINDLYDILRYVSFVYNVSLLNAFCISLGIIKSFKKKRIFLDLEDIFVKKSFLYV